MNKITFSENNAALNEELLDFKSQPQSSFHELAPEILTWIFSELSNREQGVLGCVLNILSLMIF